MSDLIYVIECLLLEEKKEFTASVFFRKTANWSGIMLSAELSLAMSLLGKTILDNF